MSFHQWKVSKVCKIIFSLQTFRLKQFGALQTSICTHKAQTKIFSSKCCLFVDQKNDFFFEVSERVAWCVHILFGVRRVYLGLYAYPNLSDTSENTPWYFDDIGKICKNRDFPPETPLRQNFLVVENEFGGALHTPKFFLEAMKVQSLPKIFFGHRNHVAWILEPLDPKIAYFGRKIADCRIFFTPKCALWVRTTPQKNFLP